MRFFFVFLVFYRVTSITYAVIAKSKFRLLNYTIALITRRSLILLKKTFYSQLNGGNNAVVLEV